ncbi:MAG TPA: hypothetical protein VLT85_01050 [Terriglobales bacterium]|nr:hypothetical protein [Terriglobales bacterium]
MKTAPPIAALGFRVHSGWAAAVAVAGPAKSPSVILRRTLILADPALAGSKQPFHAAAGLELQKAEKLIQRCTESTHALAQQALRSVVAELRKLGYRPAGACILLSSGRELGALESILASHAMIHTAEGEFFREALRRGCKKSAVPLTGIKERELLDHAAEKLRLPPGKLQARTAKLGEPLGPPWRQDEKLAALAGWLVLSVKP